MRTAYGPERRFGLAVGGIFALLGCWWLFRQKFGLIGPALAVCGGLLVFLGGFSPRFLVRPNQCWMRFAEALSFAMTRIVLFLVFILAVTPIGFLRRLFGGDPLRRRSAPAGSHWHQYPERIRDSRHYEKMY